MLRFRQNLYIRLTQRKIKKKKEEYSSTKIAFRTLMKNFRQRRKKGKSRKFGKSRTLNRNLFATLSKKGRGGEEGKLVISSSQDNTTRDFFLGNEVDPLILN